MIRCALTLYLLAVASGGTRISYSHSLCLHMHAPQFARRLSCCLRDNDARTAIIRQIGPAHAALMIHPCCRFQLGTEASRTAMLHVPCSTARATCYAVLHMCAGACTCCAQPRRWSERKETWGRSCHMHMVLPLAGCHDDDTLFELPLVSFPLRRDRSDLWPRHSGAAPRLRVSLWACV